MERGKGDILRGASLRGRDVVGRIARACARQARANAATLVYAGVAVACTLYLWRRADFIPKWGDWYMGDIHPYLYLQLRAMTSGKLALFPHPSGALNDYVWGRGGMHQAWGLGLPILALPLHLLGRLFGAPGFPDHVRFLIFYAIVAFVLTRALHRASPREPTSLGAAAAAAAFVMVFPTFVGLVSARFQIYDQTIANGVLWNILLLAGVLALFARCTPGLLALVCAAAGFATMMRVTLTTYGLATFLLALVIAHKKGLARGPLLAGVGAYLAIIALYCTGNYLRFGGPFTTGYSNGIGGSLVNRMMRWNLSFKSVPFLVQAKEMFATLFLLDPVPNQVMMGTPPEAVRPYVQGERWREYYSQTYDLFVFACLLGTLALVAWRVLRGRLWREDRDLQGELATVVGLWALPPTLGLLYFYTRLDNVNTRYIVDMSPGFTATVLCMGLAVVDAVRRRSAESVGSAQLALATLGALYVGLGRGWPTHLSGPGDAKSILAKAAEIDRRSAAMPPIPNHYRCGEPRGPAPVYTHLDDWGGDCHFRSGMVWAMTHSPCFTFTFGPNGGAWGDAESKSLAGLRVNADFDSMVSCGAPVAEGATRKVTMCDPREPPFLLDGARFYSMATLDEKLNPIDRLKLMRVDPAPACR